MLAWRKGGYAGLSWDVLLDSWDTGTIIARQPRKRGHRRPFSRTCLVSPTARPTKAARSLKITSTWSVRRLRVVESVYRGVYTRGGLVVHAGFAFIPSVLVTPVLTQIFTPVMLVGSWIFKCRLQHAPECPGPVCPWW